MPSSTLTGTTPLVDHSPRTSDDSKRGPSTDGTRQVSQFAKDIATTTRDEDLDSDENEFTELEHRAFVRKLDWHLIPFFGVVYLFCTLDRINIGKWNKQSQFSWCLSIFFVGYILFEIPSNLALRRFGANRWLGRIGILWGSISMCTAAVSSFAGFFVLRFFFGVSEAGLFPGIVFYLTHWYTRREISARIAFFYISAALSSTMGGLLAFGFGHLDYVGGLRAWQWLFLIEGIPSVLLGVATWFYIPNSPAQASWLTPREKSYAHRRIALDYTDVGDDRFEWSQFKAAVVDYKTWFYMFMFLGFLNPLYAMSLFQPTVIRDLGFSSWQAQLLTIPPSIVSAVWTVLCSIHSNRTGERGYHVAGPAVLGALGYVLLAIIPHGGGRYAIICTLLSMYNASLPPTLGWLTNNLVGSTKAATATALVISFGNFSGVISGQFYRPGEAPRYITSHLLNMAFLIMVAILALTLRFLLKRENNRIDSILQTGPCMYQPAVEEVETEAEPPVVGELTPEQRRQLPEAVVKYRNFRYTL
ncbi:hypothetical protein IWQ60_004773 [Tieghemiomyces parasiticus]|uniref:Major facilitator superfamily (MFS) profile domain-containing protein n=1 Tax=Tieghemiomyces parasiticus TaxID=78921 RepID=A0A9W8DZ19_9FUNG|nr:hypothetical protein IWQ60_004773 [Tieghemiomyces parasiticus]